MLFVSRRTNEISQKSILSLLTRLPYVACMHHRYYYYYHPIIRSMTTTSKINVVQTKRKKNNHPIISSTSTTTKTSKTTRTSVPSSLLLLPQIKTTTTVNDDDDDKINSSSNVHSNTTKTATTNTKTTNHVISNVNFLKHREAMAQELLYQYDQIIFRGVFGTTRTTTTSTVHDKNDTNIITLVAPLLLRAPIINNIPSLPLQPPIQKQQESCKCQSSVTGTTPCCCELSIMSKTIISPTTVEDMTTTKSSSTTTISGLSPVSPLVTIQWSHRIRTTAGRAHLQLHSFSRSSSRSKTTTKPKRKATKKLKKKKKVVAVLRKSQNNKKQQIQRKQQSCIVVLHQKKKRPTEKQQQLSFKSNSTKNSSKSTIDNKRKLVHIRQDDNDDDLLLLPIRRTAIIELSYKVIDDIYRLETTLLHELCHVAAWILDHVSTPPHGSIFHKYVQLVHHIIQPIIPITIKHNFIIHYQYEWECSNNQCINNQHDTKRTIQRHSRRSINIQKHVCSKCYSPLREIEVKPPSSEAMSTKITDTIPVQ